MSNFEVMYSVYLFFGQDRLDGQDVAPLSQKILLILLSCLNQFSFIRLLK